MRESKSNESEWLKWSEFKKKLVYTVPNKRFPYKYIEIHDILKTSVLHNV